jgi:hypothetical protein
VNIAKSKGKHPSQLVLDDMPSDYIKEFIDECKKNSNRKKPADKFQDILKKRKYMIL